MINPLEYMTLLYSRYKKYFLIKLLFDDFYSLILNKLNRPIILSPMVAEFIYYDEAVVNESADIAGWGAIRVSRNT